MDNTNTIFTYLDFYKDYSFDEVNFNMIDALVYSIISYIPIESIRDNSSFEVLNSIASTFRLDSSMGSVAIKILKIISKSERYKNVRLFNLVKEYNDELEFGALTFRDKSYTFIGFQGSIGTISGWKENLYLCIDFPTKTQNRSADYIKRTVRFCDRKIYIGGHSKGGNLAISSSLLLPKYITRRIKKIYNFDGPGFRKEEINSEKYKLLKDRMVNILPDGSMIGIILNNENRIFIKSKNVSIEKHFPYNWIVFGEFFVKSEENKSSKALNNKLNDFLNKLSYDERKTCIDILFELIKNKKVKSLNDLSKLEFTDIKGIISNVKNLSSDNKKVVLDAFKTFIKKEE